MSNTEINVTPTTASKDDNTTAILSYITIVGFIVAIVMHSEKKTALGAFHLRQVLGFILISVVAGLVVGIMAFILAFVPLIGPFLAMALWGSLWMVGLAFWIIGLVAAINGKQTPVPVVGEPIQRLFANAFN
ncbi:MAG TPA: hypothetical protein VK968_01310 [Roseimicrobium sp.]|nr:hypothetical protein [Roseimicrobium sp.]